MSKVLLSLKSLDTYKHHSTTILFIVGFFVDMAILPDIDKPRALYFGLAYLVSTALLIMFREWLVSRNTASKTEQKLYSFSTFGIVCLLGSALSFVFIYSMRGADIFVSWPLLVILLLCILSNELVSSHSFRFTLDVGILFLATLFYTVFHMPVILKSQNDVTFSISIAIAIAICMAYIFILKFTSEAAQNEAPRGYALAVGIPMFVGMLYFLNVLPAVPLSLNKSGIYHSIRHEGSEFPALEERDTYKGIFAKFHTPVFHLSNSESQIYFFSSINAPAELTAPISHVWEYYDEKEGKWKQSNIVSFGIVGGRTEGYRTYSFKNNVTPGLWRVTVKVGGKRVVGRETFKVEKSAAVPLTEVNL
ncbi:MAG: hypothetical protein JWN37_656 [Candidatus Nomurabacteria bacterium]|nr:hypothetical protein [Candidatus Nomurabacteria bacterium]